MMKINKIKEMSSPDLEKELGELKTELFKLRFSLATNGLDNPMKIKDVKKDIAKINTILTQRKLEEAKKGDTIMVERNLRKTMIGKVVSDKMDKAVVVAVETRKMDKTYGKIKKSTYKLKARDEENSCQVGDTVKVMETRPLSKEIRWRVVEITEKAIIK